MTFLWIRYDIKYPKKVVKIEKKKKIVWKLIFSGVKCLCSIYSLTKLIMVRQGHDAISLSPSAFLKSQIFSHCNWNVYSESENGFNASNPYVYTFKTINCLFILLFYTWFAAISALARVYSQAIECNRISNMIFTVHTAAPFSNSSS